MTKQIVTLLVVVYSNAITMQVFALVAVISVTNALLKQVLVLLQYLLIQKTDKTLLLLTNGNAGHLAQSTIMVTGHEIRENIKSAVHLTQQQAKSLSDSAIANKQYLYSHISDRKVKGYASLCVIAILKKTKEAYSSIEQHYYSHSNVKNSWATNEVGWCLHVVFQRHHLHEE
jgi:hypothetical protein